MAKKNSDFDVQVIADQVDDNTVLITSQAELNSRIDKMLFSALQKYDFAKEMYSANFSQSSSGNTLTVDRITELADGINTSLANVLEVNRYVHKYIHYDDILGETYTAVQNNVNTDYHLSYGSTEGRNKIKQLNQAKEAVEQFNKSVKINKLISEAVPGTLIDGNYIMYLRTDSGNAVIDVYPLGIAEITNWSINGNPVVQINLNEFKSRLKKTYTKDKKGKAMYFENLDKEVQANFPPEVYQAYKNGDNYCRLDWKRTGVLRINNMGYSYGVSHFFRALRPSVMLEELETADSINNKAKAKKIIHQKLRKEVMGPNTDYSRKGFEYAIYAHNELMNAWSNSTVVITTIPAVESIAYIEPSVQGTPTDKIALYRNEKMTALGITFLDPELNSVSSANISLKQLMKTVDFIARQLNDVFHRFYAVWLEEQGIDIIYTPEIRILDSEEMEMSMKIELAKFMFSNLNLSYESVLKKLGMDKDDEFAKRQDENDQGFEEVFTPRGSQFTSSGNNDSSSGRPNSNDADVQGKQDYDKNYNKNNR